MRKNCDSFTWELHPSGSAHAAPGKDGNVGSADIPRFQNHLGSLEKVGKSLGWDGKCLLRGFMASSVKLPKVFEEKKFPPLSSQSEAELLGVPARIGVG